MERATVEEIVGRFASKDESGREILAERFGLTPKAVEQWIRRNRVPGLWHLPLLDEARRRDVSLSKDELIHARRKNGA